MFQFNPTRFRYSLQTLAFTMQLIWNNFPKKQIREFTRKMFYS